MVENLNLECLLTPSNTLSAKLHETLWNAFGFKSFRPYQEDVCTAAAQGQDLLLVMPTGAGKSLCYQLPGLIRQDTTLVISPLIALIEDQVSKLKEKGLNAERIHSGRDRETSRQVCAEYLKGNLDYLFIAPERLAVPGFVEMLAKRKPALIAVDEAHCISQWGHDFRPEYRMIGERLPQLRPTPVIALTATATPQVQDDIIAQLGVKQAKRFIHGFRRDNLAVEVVEVNPSQRTQAIVDLLSEPTRRPAIIYAPTRKKAEELADELSTSIKVKAYHAGMSPKARDEVQNAFLSGKSDVIVATVAFGMGIDKANVRTVVHAALPGSIEGYYQEIGRAGRDGLPSRAVLMHSYADRKMHEFFLDRDYPEKSQLQKIYAELTEHPALQDDIRDASGLDADVFEKALEKLWIHGGAKIDFDQNVTRGEKDWARTYALQLDQRYDQLERIARYAATSSCRMLQLVAYFGDTEDGGAECGMCGICSPEDAVASRQSAMNDEEAEVATKLLWALAAGESIATGRLHKDNFEEHSVPRQEFERVLDGLVRAKLIGLREDSFEKSGQVIRYRKASLTEDGAALLRSGLGSLKDFVTLAPKRESKAGSRLQKKKKVDVKKARVEADPELVEALRAWRLQLARNKRVPAFRILSDRVLFGIAESRPTDEDGLMAVHGFGPKLAEKYGADLLAILSQATRS